MIGVRKNQSVITTSRKLRVSRKKTFVAELISEMPREKLKRQKSANGKRIIWGASGVCVRIMTTKTLGSAKMKLIMFESTVAIGMTSCGKRTRATSDAEPVMTLIDSMTEEANAFHVRRPTST